MSLYVKGTWRRYHIEPEELQQCWNTITGSPRIMFALSALAGRAILVTAGDTMESTYGINPPDHPRLDCGYMVDQEGIDRYLLPHLAVSLQDDENEEPWTLPEGAEMPEDIAMVAEDAWSRDERPFRLFDEAAGVVGFWVVSWSKQDLVDKPSLREDRSAAMTGMPYKLLSSEMKKDLFGADKEWDVAVARKQAPVIMDLRRGDIWLGSGSTKFSKILSGVLSMGGLHLTAGELAMGNTKAWVRVALNAIRDQDIYKLERAEAVGRLIEEERNMIFETVDDGTEVAPKDPEVTKRMADDHLYLSELGAWSPDEGGEVLVLQADASVALNPDSISAVTTARGSDALELFTTHPTAELVACGGMVNIPAPTIDEQNGDLAKISVDFTSELSDAIYRNLEFCAVRSIWNEMLEEPWVRNLDESSVVGDISTRTHASRYNRYWFRYYLMLCAFEHKLIHGFARVLDLDPDGVSIQSRSLFVRAESKAPEATDGVTLSPEHLATLRGSTLLPGETVTVTTPGSKAPAPAGDFLDDIPFAVD